TGEPRVPIPTGLPAEKAVVNAPRSVAVCPDGWVYWYDEGVTGEDALYGVDPASGLTTRAAGIGFGPATNGPAVSATFALVLGQLLCDAQGRLFIPDDYNNVVRVWNRG